MFSIALVAALPLLTASVAPGAIASRVVFEDHSADVAVSFGLSAENWAVFESTLPAGWTFKISVDGNKDGAWGYGRGLPDPARRSSSDRSFGQHSRNGIFCSQYIFTTDESDPSQIQTSSQCGDLRSKGRVILSGFDADGRATIKFEIPADEIFGADQAARIQLCVWDTARWLCQHQLPDLLTLDRAPAPVSP